MSDYFYLLSADANTDAAYYGIWYTPARAAEDYAELEAAWPTLEGLPDGVDIFDGIYPVAGLPAIVDN
jgi:hypothetical protein